MSLVKHVFLASGCKIGPQHLPRYLSTFQYMEKNQILPAHSELIEKKERKDIDEEYTSNSPYLHLFSLCFPSIPPKQALLSNSCVNTAIVTIYFHTHVNFDLP